MKAIEPGTQATLEVTVTDAMTVQFDELGKLHGVYATYVMAQHFEEAGRKLLLPYLEPDEDGLGSELSVQHSASALPGMKLLITATAIRQEGRKLTCDLTAESEFGVIGRGHTVQVVLPKARIEENFAALRAKWAGRS